MDIEELTPEQKNLSMKDIKDICYQCRNHQWNERQRIKGFTSILCKACGHYHQEGT